jgi:hypothetical protein
MEIMNPSIYSKFGRPRGRPLTETEVTDHRRIRDLRHGRPVEITYKLLILQHPLLKPQKGILVIL